MTFLNHKPWTARAVCQGRHHEFDTDKGANPKHYQDAIEACGYCPVLAQCRDYALRTRPVDGVWAGEIIPDYQHSRERNVVFARLAGELTTAPTRETRASNRTKRIAHGTQRGYQQHVRRGEKACTACRTANTEASKRHRIREGK